MFWKIIGMSAAVLTMFGFVPQLIKALKTKSVKDVSRLTLFQLSAGVFLWVLYGIHLQDIIIIMANTVTLITLLALLYLYFNYERSRL